MVGGVADVEKVELKLKEINRNYLEKSKRYDEYYEQYQNAAQDILTKRQVHICRYMINIHMFTSCLRPWTHFTKLSQCLTNTLSCTSPSRIQLFLMRNDR